MVPHFLLPYSKEINVLPIHFKKKAMHLCSHIPIKMTAPVSKWEPVTRWHYFAAFPTIPMVNKFFLFNFSLCFRPTSTVKGRKRTINNVHPLMYSYMKIDRTRIENCGTELENIRNFDWVIYYLSFCTCRWSVNSYFCKL